MRLRFLILILLAPTCVSATDYKKRTPEEWKKSLTPEEFEVCRRGGTERPFTGKYNASKQAGVYQCGLCGQELFASDKKFDSGTGWPSFSDVIAKDRLEFHADGSGPFARTEVRCSRCGAHLGHVFDDGPLPTRKRYCINSVCLGFAPKR